MIKFLALLFSFTVVNGQSFLYSLPKETSNFEYSLNTHLKNGTKTIIILTPSMKYPSLKAKLIKAISHIPNLTLITQNSANDPICLVAYQNVELFLNTKTNLNDTTIIIDNNFMCTQQGSLIESKTTIICTDDVHRIYASLKKVHQLRSSAKRYLK